MRNAVSRQEPITDDVVSELVARSLSNRHDAYAGEVNALLAAAVSLIEASPDRDARVVDICKAVGVSTQTFYKHFTSKDELVASLLDRGMRRLLASLEPLLQAKDDAASVVDTWVRQVVAQAADPATAPATAAVLAGAARQSPAFRTQSRQAEAALLQQLATRLRELTTGASSQAQAAAAAACVLRLAFGTLEHWLDTGHVPYDAEIDDVARFAVAGAVSTLQAPAGRTA